MLRYRWLFEVPGVYQLVIEDDEGRTTVVPLIRQELSIGRKEGNTIRLTERNVSRRHARVFRENNLFFVEDLGSYNGIRVNGERVSGKRPVREGDVIQIGDYHLRILREAERDAGRVDTDRVPFRPRGPGRAQAKTEPTLVAPPAARDRSAEPSSMPSPGAADGELDAPRLVILSPTQGLHEIPITEAGVTLGREADVSIPDRSLERVHARVAIEAGAATVRDLGGGVRVNGEAVIERTLREGDLVELGNVKLRFAASRPASAPRPVEQPAALPEEPAAIPRPEPAMAAEEEGPEIAPASSEAEVTARLEEEEPVELGKRRFLPYAAVAVGGVVAVLGLYLALRAPSPQQAPAAPTAIAPAAAPEVPRPAPPPTPAATPPPPPAAPEPAALPAAAPPESPRELGALPAEAPPPRAVPRRTARRTALRSRPVARKPEVAEAPEAPVRLRAPSPPEPAPHEPAPEPPPEPRSESVRPGAARAEEAPPAAPAAPAPAPDPEAERREKRARARDLFRQGTKVLLSSPVQAIGIFQKALELWPGLADAHKNLGIAYSALENTVAAARHYRTYLKMRPNARDATEVRRMLQEIAGGDPGP
jgi:pSer/pThr/pTyr-binding forkhead associated (FHA) protein